MGRIRWVEKPYADHGYAGRVPVASVGYGTKRQDAMWYLHTGLPVSSPLIGQHYENKEAAKAAAEKFLVAVISEMGGSL